MQQRIKHSITISPGELMINHGGTVVVSDRTMQIREDTHQGIYHDDTRFISHYRYRFNTKPLVLLTAGYVDYYSSLAHYTNAPLRMDESDLPANQLRLRVARQIDEGRVLDDLRVTNYSPRPILAGLVVELKSDFADIFEVRGLHGPFRGAVETVWDPAERTLTNTYRQKEFFAQVRYHIGVSDSAPTYSNGELVFPIRLGSQETWRAAVTLQMGTGAPAPKTERRPLGLRSGTLSADRLSDRWREVTSNISTSDEDFQHTIEAASEDLAAVRLYLPELPDDIWFPAAGVPWFLTIFGRDSEITALQTMMHYPGFARATLEVLARLQGRTLDEWRLEEPGKIAHEQRFGQFATLRQIPHTPYYGTIDATPLYIVLLSEAWRWTADRILLERYLPTARRACEWLDSYGDHDGDGFMDYWRQVPYGLKNQGWKDADNALVYPDGSQVPNPIAMVEFQGYVYDAKLRLAELEEAVGEGERAERLRAEAKSLQERFHERFWLPQEKYFAFGLGPNHKPIATIASNPGHLLWSGIVYPELAEHVVSRLLEDDMFSGWGVRTLSSRNPAFNPLDYQLGAIWPHDNAIIAHGCKRYGFGEATNRIARAIFDTAAIFQGHRLPELFGGFHRSAHSLPVLYTQANIPQAWAAGSVMQFLQAILGVEADAPNNKLHLAPTVPDWLADLRIANLSVGDSVLDLEVTRGADRRPQLSALRHSGSIRLFQNDREIEPGA
jgi:glycogen debranching enzyme